MNILDFIKLNFHFTDWQLESIERVQKLTNDDFSYKNEHVIKKTCDVYKKEISTQKEIADSASMPMPGFEELLEALSQLTPEDIVCMRFIDSTNWDGRVYFDEKNSFIGLIVGKKKNIGWKTPPNWDGSEEMLRQFNRPNTNSPIRK